MKIKPSYNDKEQDLLKELKSMRDKLDEKDMLYG